MYIHILGPKNHPSTNRLIPYLEAVCTVQSPPPFLTEKIWATSQIVECTAH